MSRPALMVTVMLTALSSPAAAGEPIPSPLQGVTVSAVVTTDATGRFAYRYTVSNPLQNTGHIWHFEVEMGRGPGEAILSAKGLVNGPDYERHTSALTFSERPMVPVGVTGPAGWLYGYGLDQSTPPRGVVSWGAVQEPARIAPGRTLGGFELTSPGLPGLREVQLEPDVNKDLLPAEYYGEPQKTRELMMSLRFRTTTVGPKAPPANFVAVEYLNYLISVLHSGRTHGWVRGDGAHQSLLAKLVNAKRKLEAGDSRTAGKILDAFLNEVRATSCQDLSCPGNKPLTSEAYALLFFNGGYLVERLP